LLADRRRSGRRRASTTRATAVHPASARGLRPGSRRPPDPWLAFSYDADILCDRLVPQLQRCFATCAVGVDAACLFGSVARGPQRADSDIDIGVRISDGRPRSLACFDQVARLRDEPSRAVDREVDLVVLNGAPLTCSIASCGTGSSRWGPTTSGGSISTSRRATNTPISSHICNATGETS
jgi:predicted nucleotidyltransferase